MAIYPIPARVDSMPSEATLLCGLIILVAAGGLDTAREGRGPDPPPSRTVPADSCSASRQRSSPPSHGVAVLLGGGRAQLLLTAPVLALPAGLLTLTWLRLHRVVRPASGFSAETRARSAAPAVVAPA